MGLKISDFPEHVQKQIKRKSTEQQDSGIGAPASAVPHDHSMNKTEQNYAGHLATLKHAGEIKDFLFEPFNIRLGKRTFYKPDFLVVNGDNEIEIHEVKGYWQDDALVKIKLAAERVPWFRFKAVSHESGHWKYRTFEPFRGTK